MSVKRYEMCVGGSGVTGDEFVYADAVLASDYDEMADELADAHKVCAEWGAKEYTARLRIAALESALSRAYHELKVEEVDPDECRASVLAILSRALDTAAEIEGKPQWLELAPDELPCANCGQSIDKHFGPGLPCPESDRGEKR